MPKPASGLRNVVYVEPGQGQALRRALHTVRVHLKRVFEKAKASRQVELVQMIGELPRVRWDGKRAVVF